MKTSRRRAASSTAPRNRSASPLLDYDRDGWPDLLIANDTQPNKLYRNLRNGTFEDVGVRAGVAFSEDGKARAGMGVDVADFDNSGTEGIAITNFDNEMMALYRPGARRHVTRMSAQDRGRRPGVARQPGIRLRVPRYRSGRPARPGRGQRSHR